MAFDNIHNYYEKLVSNEIQKKVQDDVLENNEDILGDIACVALNKLPAHYVRHDVDMAFYMTAEEREEKAVKVKHAIIEAIDFVKAHQHSKTS